MARGRHSHVPSAAKLASGVTVAGVCLGFLLALAVNPEMKSSAEPWWSLSTGANSTHDLPTVDWLYEAPRTPQVADGFRPDFDYDEVVGEQWAMPESELGLVAAPLPSVEEALEAADEAAEAATAAEEAAVDQPPAEPGASVRKSQLGQDGIY